MAFRVVRQRREARKNQTRKIAREQLVDIYRIYEVKATQFNKY
jgi:hypothetical protein